MTARKFLVNLSATDRPGIVAALSSEISDMGANILESAQYRDPETEGFFMRTAFITGEATTTEALEERLGAKLSPLGADLRVTSLERKPRIIVMVSKFDHALLHILYQIKVGWMQANVVAIVSNHEDSRETAEREGIPFHFWPVNPSNKQEQEDRLMALVEDTHADLVVLARYMQVLTDDLCQKLSGRAINIHHSFLPAFKGANPYKRAHERGVKLIGATAHYVTGDLDEGPIIEQDIQRVTHRQSAKEFVAEGRNVESRVLAYAVKMHLENRVMINGTKTVVFD